MDGRSRVLLGVIAALGAPTAAPARAPVPLVAPARCVSDYLEAVASAAPPHPRRVRPPAATGAEPRWARARSYLAPRAAGALDQADGGPRPLAPWSTLGRDGAFLGYELLGVRHAPLGAAVVLAEERTVPNSEAAAATAVCAYLVARVGGEWRIADKRCGRDFADEEVLSRYRGSWDEPTASAPAPAAGQAGAKHPG